MHRNQKPTFRLATAQPEVERFLRKSEVRSPSMVIAPASLRRAQCCPLASSRGSVLAAHAVVQRQKAGA